MENVSRPFFKLVNLCMASDLYSPLSWLSHLSMATKQIQPIKLYLDQLKDEMSLALHILFPVLLNLPVSFLDKHLNFFVFFLLNSSFFSSVGASLFALFFIYRYRKYDTPSDMANSGWGGSSQPEKLLDDPRHSCKRLSYHVLITTIFAAYNLTEIGFSSFQNAYYQQRNVSVENAANLGSIGSAAYTLGRLVNVVLTRFLSISLLLYGHLILAAFGFIGLYLIQDYLQMAMWALIIDSVLIGYAQSAINPALFGFAASFAKLDDRHNSIYYTALGLPMLFAPFIIGPNIEKMPSIVLHLALGPIILTMVLFIIIRLIIGSARRSMYN